MGMFDYIRCEYPLPDFPLELSAYDAKEFPFQTKDTNEQYLLEYLISTDGQLSLDGEFQDFTGDVVFYHSNVCASGPGTYTRNGEDSFWLEYQAVFIHGKLTHIERLHFGIEPAQKSSEGPWRDRPEFKTDEERDAWWKTERKKFQDWQNEVRNKREIQR